jgi:hypothetical protein
VRDSFIGALLSKLVRQPYSHHLQMFKHQAAGLTGALLVCVMLSVAGECLSMQCGWSARQLLLCACWPRQLFGIKEVFTEAYTSSERMHSCKVVLGPGCSNCPHSFATCMSLPCCAAAEARVNAIMDKPASVTGPSRCMPTCNTLVVLGRLGFALCS